VGGSEGDVASGCGDVALVPEAGTGTGVTAGFVEVSAPPALVSDLGLISVFGTAGGGGSTLTGAAAADVVAVAAGEAVFVGFVSDLVGSEARSVAGGRACSVVVCGVSVRVIGFGGAEGIFTGDSFRGVDSVDPFGTDEDGASVSGGGTGRASGSTGSSSTTGTGTGSGAGVGALIDA
jgi:hypothetical protein